MTTIAVLVIGKSDQEVADFHLRSPSAQDDARIICISNPGKVLGNYAAIANPFLDTATEDVVGIVHADTNFAAGAVRTFADTAAGGCLAGIVGRRAMLPSDPDPWVSYVWCTNGGGKVSTLDSCSVFMQRSLGLRVDGITFDDFHCVVEDLCLQARAHGIPAIVPQTSASHIGGNTSQGWMDGFFHYRKKLALKWPNEDIHTV